MQVNGKLRPSAVDENEPTIERTAAAPLDRLSVMKTFWGSLSEEETQSGRQRERHREVKSARGGATER